MSDQELASRPIYGQLTVSRFPNIHSDDPLTDPEEGGDTDVGIPSPPPPLSSPLPPPLPPKSKRSRKAITPRSPLPAHTTRVQNPGEPDKPHTKRTTAEVTKFAKRKAKLALEIQELERAKVHMLAEMEIDLERQDELEALNTVKNVADSRNSGDYNAGPFDQDIDSTDSEIEKELASGNGMSKKARATGGKKEVCL